MKVIHSCQSFQNNRIMNYISAKNFQHKSLRDEWCLPLYTSMNEIVASPWIPCKHIHVHHLHVSYYYFKSQSQNCQPNFIRKSICRTLLMLRPPFSPDPQRILPGAGVPPRPRQGRVQSRQHRRQLQGHLWHQKALLASTNLHQVNTVIWEPEGRYCRPKMFHWDPEERYCHTLCTVIAPFWFSTEHLWTAIMPFWLSTDDIKFNLFCWFVSQLNLVNLTWQSWLYFIPLAVQWQK